MILGVTGNPILHSKSPLIFRAIFASKQRNHSYLRIAADTAEEALFLFKELGLHGMNVTAPFKEDMAKLVDKVGPEVRAIGGINTVVYEENELWGYNTDYFGVIKALAEKGVDLTDKKCLVIGAGGTARAVLYALKINTPHIVIVNRTEEKAAKLAKQFGCKYNTVDNLKKEVKQADIIIYTLSSDVELLKAEWVESRHVLYDVNYKKSFINAIAKDKSCAVLVKGEDMLIHQAFPACVFFTGDTPDIEVMREAVYQKKEKTAEVITLIGFMASGKTKAGKALAKKMNYEFIDTDKYIVKKYHKTIPEIFEEMGEERFREIETEVLKEVLSLQRVIISTGGGIVLKEENRRLLKEKSLPIWLYANPETSVNRSNHANRPLLQVEDPIAKAKELLASRLELYADAAELVVSTEKWNEEKVINKIYEEYHKSL